MSVYGYVRKVYPINVTEQLKQIMPYACETVFIEEASLSDDSELNSLLDQIVTGDIVVVASLKVFGKSLSELIALLQFFYDKAIRLVCLEGELDTQNPLSFYEAAQLVAESEIARKQHQLRRSLILTRVKDSPAGRPTIKSETINNIQRYYIRDKLTLREIAEKCHVSLGTVHKYTKQI